MSEQEQTKPLGGQGRTLRCDEWENLLADALDGTLSAADRAAFTRHQNECALCAQMFKETDQGKAWMQYLTVEPEVPADLLGKILARTSETAGTGSSAGSGCPGPHPARPPLAPGGTAGGPPGDGAKADDDRSHGLLLHCPDPEPDRDQSHPAAHGRSSAFPPPGKSYPDVLFHQWNKAPSITRILRVVYEMESRVRELRRATTAEPVPTPRETPKAPGSRWQRQSQFRPFPGDSKFPRRRARARRNRRIRPAPRRRWWPPAFIARGEAARFTRKFFGPCDQSLHSMKALQSMKVMKAGARGDWYELP